MMYTDNPVADFERYSAKQEAELDKLPKCSRCDDPIQQEDAVYINEEWFCDRCLEELRKEVPVEW